MGTVLNFPKGKIVRKPGLRQHSPLNRVFPIGIVTTMQNGLRFKWDARYWVKRGPDAQYWHVFCSTDEVGKGFLSMSTHTPEGVIGYFQSLGFEITTGRWLAMGWRPTVRASPAKVHSLHGRDRDD